MAKAQILIVEDDAIVAMDIQNRLKNLGYTVAGVVNYAEKAIEKAKELKPDLVLMDIVLKGEIDWIETSEIIRYSFNIPVIFLTAYADELRLERAKLTMPFGYILKPFQDRDLKITIEMALYTAKADAERRQTEKALAISEAEFKAIFSSMPDAAIFTDAQRRIAAVNQAFIKIFGYDSEEVIGRTTEFLYETKTDYLEEHGIKYYLSQSDLNSQPIEVRYRRKDGTLFWAERHGRQVKDAHGNVIGFFEINRDISERKQAEELLRFSEEKYRMLVENIPDVIMRIDRECRYIYVSPSIQNIVGLKPEDFIGKTLRELDISYEQYSYWEEKIKYVFNKGEMLESEFEFQGINGHLIINWRIFPEFDKEGKISTLVGIVKDITANKKFLYGYKTLFNQMLDGFALNEIICDEGGRPINYRCLAINPAFERITGLLANDVIGKTIFEIMPEIEESWVQACGKVALTGEPLYIENYNSGVVLGRNFEITIYSPSVGQFACIFKDISGRVIAEKSMMAALENSQKRGKETSALLACSKAVLENREFRETVRVIFNVACNLIGVVSGYIALLSKDKTENELLFLESGGLPCLVNPDLPMPIRGLRQEAYRIGKAVYDNNFLNGEWIKFIPKGHVKLDNVLFAPLNIQGKTVGLIGLANKPGGFNENDARMAEAFGEFTAIAFTSSLNIKEILEKTQMNQMLLDALPCVTMLLKASTREIVASNEAGKKAGAYPGKTCYETWGQRNAPCPWCLSQKTWETGAPQHMEVKVPHKIWDVYWVPIGDDLYLHYGFDITERSKMEQQLRQAQKMEAIGTLAGGIAHDFNNILSPILIHSEMAMMELPYDSPIQQHLDNIYKAGERARSLVKQILHFARRREEGKMPLKVSLIVKETVNFLRSTIPSTIDILYDFMTEKDTVFADPTHINQILLNLCTNSVHAMRGKGGILTLSLTDEYIGSDETDWFFSLSPGHYLRLVVSDTGSGIFPEVIDKIFEPYFTTKEPGEGTGLGLAVIHGIINSSGGNITVKSDVGKGTSFHVLLPIIDEEILPITETTTKLPGGKERILFIDDDKAIVNAVKSMLDGLGYDVTVRTSSIEAIKAFRIKYDEFDLVITDMTMPNMTGKELTRELLTIRSDIPIILCTGFSEEIDKDISVELGIAAFVMKPISMRDLANTIRKVLDH